MATGRVNPLANAGSIPTTRAVNTTSPLTGGGPLSGDLSLDLDPDVSDAILNANAPSIGNPFATMLDVGSVVVRDAGQTVGLTSVDLDIGTLAAEECSAFITNVSAFVDGIPLPEYYTSTFVHVWLRDTVSTYQLGAPTSLKILNSGALGAVVITPMTPSNGIVQVTCLGVPLLTINWQVSTVRL